MNSESSVHYIHFYKAVISYFLSQSVIFLTDQSPNHISVEITMKFASVEFWVARVSALEFV